MPDIFDEVDEDLRADRAHKLLRRYGGAIIGAAAAVVVAVGGWEAWKWYDARARAQTANAYIAAMRTADAAVGEARGQAAAEFTRVAGESGPGYRALALLRAAGLKADAGDLPGAVALWDQVASDSAVDPLLRDLAALQAATRQLDTGDPAQLLARLKPLTAPNNPWRSLALEAQALLALRQGKTDEARDGLKQLSQDPGAPEGVRQRSAALLQRLNG